MTVKEISNKLNITVNKVHSIVSKYNLGIKKGYFTILDKEDFIFIQEQIKPKQVFCTYCGKACTKKYCTFEHQEEQKKLRIEISKTIKQKALKEAEIDHLFNRGPKYNFRANQNGIKL